MLAAPRKDSAIGGQHERVLGCEGHLSHEAVGWDALKLVDFLVPGLDLSGLHPLNAGVPLGSAVNMRSDHLAGAPVPVVAVELILNFSRVLSHYFARVVNIRFLFAMVVVMMRLPHTSNLTLLFLVLHLVNIGNM